jgi:hypothetical protein
MKPRPRLRWLPVVAVAVASFLATPALPAAASVTNQTVAAATTCAISRPHSGTILHAGISGGLGVLTIKNRISQDAAVILVLGRSKAISVYVRAGATTTLGHIKPGTYSIYFTVGSSFSVCQARFTRAATYWRVKNHLPFAAPPHFTVATLTLFAVKGGNAPTTQISPKGFPTP